MPSSSEIRAMLCLWGGFIRLLISALTASLQRRIALLHQAPRWFDLDGMEMRHLSWQRWMDRLQIYSIKDVISLDGKHL